MDFDLVIHGGTVVDGSGLASYQADIGIKGGRIDTIGRIREKGHRHIDAEGHVVTPGFIDGHTHMDAQVFWDPLGSSSCWHGVTTAVMGNCGFTLAPAKPHERPLVVRNLERAEDISPAALAAGVPWSWEGFREYLEAVDRAPKAINYAASIGHSALRTWAMGEAAFERTANESELSLMKREVHDALQAGAIGFTTSRSEQHETSDDRPVASRLASWNEVRQLVGVLGSAGGGIFQLANEVFRAGHDPKERDTYFEALRTLAVETGVPTTFGITATAEGFDRLKFIEDTAAAGGRMFGLSRCRDISGLLSFRTRLPFDTIEEWKSVRELPLDSQAEVFRDANRRRLLIRAAHEGDYGRVIGGNPRKPDYDALQVLRNPGGRNPTVGELARASGADPVDLMIDLALQSDFNVFFVQPFEHQDPQNLLQILRHPRAVMTFSDSGAHVSQISDCSIHTQLLAEFVRDRQLITLEEAVRMLTLAPALAFGFFDRGLLREGMAADLNVFNPATVAPAMPTVEHDLPGGARRLVQKAVGFRATVVGGEITIEDGRPTGQRSGRLLRGRLARA